MEYLLHIAVIVGIYAIIALSADLLIGHTGLLSVAHAGFCAIGAYCSAILATQLGAPFLVGALAGAVVAAVVATVVSLPTLRLCGDYLAIATFAFQVIVVSVLQNWTAVTRGPLGIVGIPRPNILGWSVDTTGEYALLAWVWVGLTYFIVRQIVRSPFGRVIRAIREDEAFAQSLGKRTYAFKLRILIMSAVLAALAGSLYAHYLMYIDPSSFILMESILVVAMVILGGSGSLAGPILGALLLVVTPEALRFCGLPEPIAASMRQALYGVLLVLLLIFRPQGLLRRYVMSPAGPTGEPRVRGSGHRA